MIDKYNENVIEWLTGDDTVTMTLSQKKYVNRIKRLGAAYIEAENTDGSILAYVPLSWIKISPPRKVSEEQKERMREMKKNSLKGI